MIWAYPESMLKIVSIPILRVFATESQIYVESRQPDILVMDEQMRKCKVNDFIMLRHSKNVSASNAL